LGEAPDNVLYRERERKISCGQSQILRDWRQKESETLTYPHSEREQQGDSNDDESRLAASRDL